MHEAQLLGSLAWLALGVGYAWTVRKLARMARAPQENDVTRVVLVPACRHAAEPSSAPGSIRLETSTWRG